MSRKRQFLIISLSVLVLVSALSHSIARWLGMRVQAVIPLHFGATNQPAVAFAAGSSLMFYGIDWRVVANDLGGSVRGFAVPAGSVHEMEILQRTISPVRCTLLGIGISDLNENYVSDYRADIVPLGHAAQTLREARANVSHAKHVLSQYPLKYVRYLFPTTGRSVAVMAGVRDKLRTILRRRAVDQPTERAVISSESNGHTDNITSWPTARVQRNIVDIGASGGNEMRFDGEKHLALRAFLNRAKLQGKVVLVVLPESPTYQRQFVTPEVRKRFEEVITEAQKNTPELVCIRLDEIPELQSDAIYWDLVHLNAPGQTIATAKLRARLSESGILR